MDIKSYIFTTSIRFLNTMDINTFIHLFELLKRFIIYVSDVLDYSDLGSVLSKQHAVWCCFES
jgi:hypothetical protein